jgi:hypothetical protein
MGCHPCGTNEAIAAGEHCIIDQGWIWYYIARSPTASPVLLPSSPSISSFLVSYQIPQSFDLVLFLRYEFSLFLNYVHSFPGQVQWIQSTIASLSAAPLKQQVTTPFFSIVLTLWGLMRC